MRDDYGIHPDEKFLLIGIAKRPYDPVVRAAYADWLEEQGFLNEVDYQRWLAETLTPQPWSDGCG